MRIQAVGASSVCRSGRSSQQNGREDRHDWRRRFGLPFPSLLPQAHGGKDQTTDQI